MGLGSDFSVTVQLPDIILISLVISGEGCGGGGILACAIDLLAKGFAGLSLSCASTSAEMTAINVIRKTPPRIIFIVPPEKENPAARILYEEPRGRQYPMAKKSGEAHLCGHQMRLGRVFFYLTCDIVFEG
jgi:hypothetical protein